MELKKTNSKLYSKSTSCTNINGGGERNSLIKLHPSKMNFNLGMECFGQIEFNKNKESLREVITNYILQRLGNSKKKQRIGARKGVKYPDITLKVVINGENKEILINFIVVLEKYLQLQAKNIYRHFNIEPVIIDVLNFIDDLDDLSKEILFQFAQIDENIRKEGVITMLIEKYQKDKQKICRIRQCEQYKRKIVAKHAKVSYIDVQSSGLQKKQHQYFVEKSETSKRETKMSENNQLFKPSTKLESELGKLLEKQHSRCFFNDGTIKQIKRKHLKRFYRCHNMDFDIIQKKAKDQTALCFGFRKGNMDQNMKFLEEWISEITTSQILYEERFQSKLKKDEALKKQIIIQQDSSSDISSPEISENEQKIEQNSVQNL